MQLQIAANLREQSIELNSEMGLFLSPLKYCIVLDVPKDAISLVPLCVMTIFMEMICIISVLEAY